ncbi:HNH endonuclease [Planctomycetota bacterium]|nr:HNH endonuclease [Planctomycetota bacterium]
MANRSWREKLAARAKREWRALDSETRRKLRMAEDELLLLEGEQTEASLAFGEIPGRGSQFVVLARTESGPGRLLAAFDRLGLEPLDESLLVDDDIIALMGEGSIVGALAGYPVQENAALEEDSAIGERVPRSLLRRVEDDLLLLFGNEVSTTMTRTGKDDGLQRHGPYLDVATSIERASLVRAALVGAGLAFSEASSSGLSEGEVPTGREVCFRLEPTSRYSGALLQTDDAFLLELSTKRLVDHVNLSEIPPGVESPTRYEAEGARGFRRDMRVRAWVLAAARGACELCDQPAPFHRVDGTPYLEVHHPHTLANGGPDTVRNAVAICPACHRELHLGENRESRLGDLYSKVERLAKPAT